MIKPDKTKSCLFWAMLLLMTACSTPEPFHHVNATGHYNSDIVQCAVYARKVSGIGLYGDADGWWEQAAFRYKRGHVPEPGSVLVLKKTSRMHSGHVAVVKSVVNVRQIKVTHSNWGDSRHSRRIVYDSMLAEDVSSKNDWSRVRFWNDGKNGLGFPYEAYGFIYP